MSIPYPKVVVVTIMFGDRWKFLSQVVNAMMRDEHVINMIIVDNGSQNEVEIKEGTASYGDRITILRQEKNLGSAGGFAKGLEHARTIDCDFVFILDDDSVPEDGAIDRFMDIRKLFPDTKVVLSGNRLLVPRNEDQFYKSTIESDFPRGTFFEVFSWKKVLNFLKIFFGRSQKEIVRGPFVPVVPSEAFVYGGAFLPIEAVREAPLPDASLGLYGDDLEYAWGIKKLGYHSYGCAHPRIYDVDLTFGHGSHIFGMFEKNLAPFKAYHRIRNMVRLSVKHSPQNKFVLFISIIVWMTGFFILGLIKQGPTPHYFKRVWLFIQAVLGGYNKNRPTPKYAQLP